MIGGTCIHLYRALVLLMLLTVGVGQSNAEDSIITVYRNAMCHCCKKWVAHLVEHGFAVREVEVDQVGDVRRRLGVPAMVGACHTAEIGPYKVEGHVPASAIRQLLNTRPDNTAGIAVPGMPIGSPGMEGPGAKPYQVVAFDRQGNIRHYQTINPSTDTTMR